MHVKVCNIHVTCTVFRLGLVMLFNDCVGFLPAPIAPSQLAARLLAQQKYERIQVHKYLRISSIFLNYFVIH